MLWIILGIIAALLIITILVLSIFLFKKPKKNTITAQGITIYLTDGTQYITEKLLDSWINKLVDFWVDKKGWARDSILEAIARTNVYFEDSDRITTKNQHGEEIYYAGLTWVDNKTVFISTFNKEEIVVNKSRFLSLFNHEVSHIITAKNDSQYYNEELSHQLFQEVRLGVLSCP
jgi:hypothetical protein